MQRDNTKQFSFKITDKYDIATTGNFDNGNASALDIAYAQERLFHRFLTREIKEQSYKITGDIGANTVPELKTLTSSYNAARRNYSKQLELEFPDRQQQNRENQRMNRSGGRVRRRGFGYYLIYYQ